jgi:putative NIF3 family GTP cyclohydrolase 1 type 2
MFEKLATNTQVGTFVGMHISDRNLDVAKENHINVIVAGHTASDSLGLNLLLGEVLKGTSVEIIPCSGYDRIERN